MEGGPGFAVGRVFQRIAGQPVAVRLVCAHSEVEIAHGRRLVQRQRKAVAAVGLRRRRPEIGLQRAVYRFVGRVRAVSGERRLQAARGECRRRNQFPTRGDERFKIGKQRRKHLAADDCGGGVRLLAQFQNARAQRPEFGVVHRFRALGQRHQQLAHFTVKLGLFKPWLGLGGKSRRVVFPNGGGCLLERREQRFQLGADGVVSGRETGDQRLETQGVGIIVDVAGAYRVAEQTHILGQIAVQAAERRVVALGAVVALRVPEIVRQREQRQLGRLRLVHRVGDKAGDGFRQVGGQPRHAVDQQPVDTVVVDRVIPPEEHLPAVQPVRLLHRRGVEVDKGHVRTRPHHLDVVVEPSGKRVCVVGRDVAVKIFGEYGQQLGQPLMVGVERFAELVDQLGMVGCGL